MKKILEGEYKATIIEKFREYLDTVFVDPSGYNQEEVVIIVESLKP